MFASYGTRRREHDLRLVWRDRDFVRGRGCGWWLRGVPLVGMRSESLGSCEGECWILLPPSMCATGGASTGIAAWILRTDRLRSCPAGSPTLPRGLGSPWGSTAEHMKFIEDRGGAFATQRGCAVRWRSAPSATASGRRLSHQPRRMRNGNPCSRADTPAPTVDGQNH